MTSRSLILTALALLVVFLGLTLRTCSSGGLLSRSDADTAEAQSAVGDRDSVRDTLETINQRMKAATQEVRAEREARSTFEAGIEKEFQVLSDELLQVKQARGEQIRGLKGELERLTRKLAAASAKETVPVGQAPTTTTGLVGYTWIKPIGNASGTDRPAANEEPDRSGFLLDSLGAAGDEAGVLPVITIPENSTLVGATAMTGLFGRVPKRGAVRDPLPFKVITGAENLAAQGWEIPNLENAIWRGLAKGDGTLHCVEGELISVTFVFTDGTIRTVRGGDNTERLGTLSDANGYPCLPGAFVSDFPKFLRAMMGAGAAAGAADALAAAETTTSITTAGSTVRSVTGDAGTYIAGRAASEGFAELAAMIRDRYRDTFDAVVVQPGAAVALHIERAIHVDYETDGRRISFVDEEGRYVEQP